MSATATPNKRIRQIAILLASVDAATAQQLLLHLPTETAKAVRGMAGKLGAVSAEEKTRIVNEFRKAATGAGSLVAESAPMANTAQIESPPTTIGDQPDAATTRSNVARHTDSVQHPKWGEISVASLLNFLRDERPAVIAVVVSQLEPAFAVQILQELPSATNRAVLQRMSTLGDVDATAMASIEEYLSERLEEYQQIYRSQAENRRRMDALLAAAPTALREQWQAAFDEDDADEATSGDAKTQVNSAPTSTSDGEANSEKIHEPALAAVNDVQDSFEPSSAAQSLENDSSDSAATILPFPRNPRDAASTKPPSSQANSSSYFVGANLADADHAEQVDEPPAAQRVDSSFIRLDFDALLDLQTEQLAAILSEPDSQTVLLALAGATPKFMQRFYSMLRSEDAHALRTRLSKLGTINLRDVDNAQLELLDLAERFLPETIQRQAA
ncbi:MAG TPA: hypothetical protein DDW52_01585 [Planctomycetaceae bacterium]|nr:hypothetical protein [Planctomycetaceae bacterium]